MTIPQHILSAHHHWDQYSGDGEETLYPRLHQMALWISHPNQIITLQPIIEQILSEAKSKGYADEDSFLSSRPETPTPYSLAVAEQHDEDPDSDYTAAVSQSLAAIIADVKGSPVENTIQDIRQQVSDARATGQRERRAFHPTV